MRSYEHDERYLDFPKDKIRRQRRHRLRRCLRTGQESMDQQAPYANIYTLRGTRRTSTPSEPPSWTTSGRHGCCTAACSPWTYQARTVCGFAPSAPDAVLSAYAIKADVRDELMLAQLRELL